MIKVGFTGTSRGMTSAQLQGFSRVILDLAETNNGVEEFHHGDCIGSDEEADDKIRMLYKYIGNPVIVVHPPDNPSKRAFCLKKFSLGVSRREKPYLDRNHDIVDETEVLIATPLMETEVQRSGTWATVRYARKKGKRVILVNPDGTSS